MLTRLPVLLLMAAFLLAAPARAQPAGVVVNEILYDPGPSDEFVELYNRSDEAVDLGTLRFSDNRGNPVAVTNEETLLQPGEYAVLVRDAEAFAAAFPEVGFIEPPSWPQLNNSGDAVLLYNADGEVIEEVAYDGGLDEVSLERIDPEGPSNAETNFAASTAPEGATPGAQNSVFAVDETPPALEAVRASEDAATLTVTFSEALDAASVSAERFELRPGGAPAVTAAALSPDDAAEVQLTLASALQPGRYTLAAQGLSDLRGNTLDEESTLQFSVVGETDTPAPRDIVINEISYAPPTTEGEFVELYNRSEKTFDLSQFAFADERGQPVPITDAPTSLQPDDYAVLVRDAEAFSERFPEVNFIEVASWPALNNDGDQPTLLFDGETIDAVPYEPTWGGGGGATLERIDPDGPSTSASNFGSSTAPEGGTPGRQNSIFAPDEAGPRPVFAEEVAPQTVEVFFSEPVAPASVEPSDFSLEDGSTPESVVLVEDGLAARLVFAEGLSGTEIRVSGVRDLTGNPLDEATVPLAYIAAPGEVVINEVMYDPLSDDFDGQPDQPEYFELLNTTERAVTLSGFFWTDVPDEEGEADTLFFNASQAGVAPGGYAVVYATPEDGSLAEAFPETDFSDPQATPVPIGRSALGLRNGGDLIEVHRADGVVLDSVRYDPDWHLDGLEDPTGTSLERIVPGGPSNAPSNWTSSAAASGGTPGRSNAALLPGGPPPDTGIAVEPSPFSPNGDGMEDVTAILYTLSAPASLARIRIYDSYGRQVYEEEAALVGRAGQIPWDGHSSDGKRLRVGIYVVLFEALGADGGTVDRFKAPVVLARPLN